MKLLLALAASFILRRGHGFSSIFSIHSALKVRAMPLAASIVDNNLEPLVIVPAIDIFPMTSAVKYDHKKSRSGSAVADFVKERGLDAIDTDPFELVAHELKPFSSNIKELVEADQPVLSAAASHFFEKRHGKRFRPTIVMLIAKAAAGTLENTGTEAYTKQAQLGQITEMIHVASLIHDDVLDEADTRRGGEAVHKLYSNKVAVLSGDYLLARASVLLAKLENVDVVQIMASALDSLVQGEIMQIKSAPNDVLELSYYLRKSFYKTSSLICDACKSCVILGGHDENSELAEAAKRFGFHFGLAYQIVDDILDFTGSAEDLGKPAMADVSLGLATAPILYASMECSELKPIIKRRFKDDGDKERAQELVLSTNGVARAEELAIFHAQSALEALEAFPPCVARDALKRLTSIVLTRNK